MSLGWDFVVTITSSLFFYKVVFSGVAMVMILFCALFQSHDIQEFIPLMNQLIVKYKQRIAPFLNDIFMPVVQTIICHLEQPFDPANQEVTHTHIHTHRQTDRQTDTQTDRHTYIQTDSEQTHTHTR